MAATFMSNYTAKLAATKTALDKIDADIRKIEHDEMAQNVKPSDITKFAQDKQKLHEKKNEIKREKGEAATYKAQITAFRSRVSSIGDEIKRVEEKEAGAGKPSDVTQYAIQKQKLYDEKNKLVQQEKDVGKEAAKLKNF